MEICAGPLPGCYHVRLKRFDDARGSFVKTFSRSLFQGAGISFDLKEEFYSSSDLGVIRGMHFQLPPYDHDKVVYCANGAVEDVLLDLRRGANYGAFRSITLSAAEPTLLFIPKGIAHGFESLTDGSLMIYKTSVEYAPQHDSGVRWDSFGCRWQTIDPIMSDRDRRHPTLADFDSPF